MRNSENRRELYEVEREYGRNTSQHQPGWPSRKKKPDIATWLKLKKTPVLATKYFNAKKIVNDYTNYLTGTTKENPLPPRTDDKQLADEFANYFIDKIKNIRANMDHNELFLPTSHDDVPKLTEFRLFLEKEVEEIVMGMQSKTCELDPIPTSIIKENLDKFLPTITALVNISLG